MNEVFQLLQKANQYFKTADHLCHATYPLVNDPKLLMIITENIFNALNAGLSAMVYYESLYKRAPVYEEDFISKFNVFRSNCAERYNFPRESVIMIKEVRDLITERKEAPVEFSRKDRYIIASDSYKLKALSLDMVKRYLSHTKSFIERINEVFEFNGRP
ncbi:MAG: hypothetical protein Q8R00_01970 [Candidatus Nanoarchaeia archaeon]|nr:hypothetical protein [Candidatus Nanoarchaeia archaeon]